MKNICLIVCFFALFAPQVKAQNALAKIEYSEAERSFQQKDYQESLGHLEKVKEFLGSTNAKVMFLEILAKSQTISLARNTLEDYQVFQQLETLASTYLTSFEKSAPLDKIKQIYDLQKKYAPLAIESKALIMGKKAMDNEELNKATPYFQTACTAGNPEACKNLGNINLTQEQYDKTAKYWDRAIDLGSINAKFNKGRSLYFDDGLIYPADKVLGKKMLLEVYNDGYDYATLELAKAYRSEITSKDDPALKKVTKLYKKAYNLGNKNAVFHLYFNAYQTDPKTTAEVMEYFKNALEKDPTNGRYQFLYATILERNLNYKRALELFTEGAKNGDDQSHIALSVIYGDKNWARKYGVKKDRKRSRLHQEKACEINPKRCR